MPGFQGSFELGHALCTIRSHARHDGVVVRIQCCPAQGNHVFASVQQILVGFLRVCDHRSMARRARIENHICLALDFDHMAAVLEAGPTGLAVFIRNTVDRGVIRVQLLQIKVLHIGAGIGHAPGHFFGTTQHHKGQTRKCGPNHLQAWRLQAGKVPDGRCTQTQMGVVGQQGFAADSIASGDHPVVAAFALHGSEVVDKLA